MTDAIVVKECDSGCDPVTTNQAGPWTRFWARICDVNLWALPVVFLVGFLFPGFVSADVFSQPGGEFLLGVCLMPVVMLVDAGCLAIFGNTPGKALSGIRIETIRHDKLNFSQAIRRNGLVYFKGMGLGIPLIYLATFVSNLSRLNSGRQTSWDESLFTRVYDFKSNTVRRIIVAVLALAIAVAGRIVTWMPGRQAPFKSQSASAPLDASTSSVDPISVQLAKIAATISPKVIDSITRLDGAHAEGRVFVYEYSITRRDFSNTFFEKYFRKSVMPTMCANPGLRNDMKDYEITYRFQYSMPNASEPLVYDIKWGDCQALEH